MERFYEQTIFKYLRCEPEDHYFLLVSNFLAKLSCHLFSLCIDCLWVISVLTGNALVRGALTSFGVICKTIAHSIQNCLLYLLAKF